MKLAIAIQIDGDTAGVAAVAFDEWDAAEAARTFTARIAPVEKPARGAIDLREVRAVEQLLRQHALQPDALVIDGPVHLDAAETPGWGRRLFDALGCRTPVIGVSTKPLPGLPAQFEVDREEEARPVLVTCAGLDLGAAKARVRTMHGRKRMPTLAKVASRLAKGASGAA